MKIRYIRVLWVVVIIIIISIVMGAIISKLFFILASLAFAFYWVYSSKRLVCKKCGHRDNLEQFTRAINHDVYCRFCGNRIIVLKEGDQRDEDA